MGVEVAQPVSAGHHWPKEAPYNNRSSAAPVSSDQDRSQNAARAGQKSDPSAMHILMVSSFRSVTETMTEGSTLGVLLGLLFHHVFFAFGAFFSLFFFHHVVFFAFDAFFSLFFFHHVIFDVGTVIGTVLSWWRRRIDRIGAFIDNALIDDAFINNALIDDAFINNAFIDNAGIGVIGAFTTGCGEKGRGKKGGQWP